MNQFPFFIPNFHATPSPHGAKSEILQPILSKYQTPSITTLTPTHSSNQWHAHPPCPAATSPNPTTPLPPNPEHDILLTHRTTHHRPHQQHVLQLPPNQQNSSHTFQIKTQSNFHCSQTRQPSMHIPLMHAQKSPRHASHTPNSLISPPECIQSTLPPPPRNTPQFPSATQTWKLFSGTPCSW